MTRFLDVRIDDIGGLVAPMVATKQGTTLADYKGLALTQLQLQIAGRHVLIGTHGFNVTRRAGIESLSNWEKLLSLPGNSVFIGLLWPGDSSWLPVLDYPAEPTYADQSGDVLGPFLDVNFAGAASISFASHSLGVRTVLEAIRVMKRSVRRLIVMAGAIDNTCLNGEFQSAATRIDQISVLASTRDFVLAAAFPLGNVLGGILTSGHPWYREALGRGGPSLPAPHNFVPPFEIPSDWDYGHLDYLAIHNPPPATIPFPADVEPPGSPEPDNGANGWHEGWSAAFASSRFR